MKRLVPIVLLVLLMPGVVARQEEPPPEPVEETTAVAAGVDVLSAIRNDLVELRFEEALNRIEALMARSDLDPETRIAGLILRAEAHVAYGDLDAAEQDYRAILELRPAYVPDASLTPPKAVERFKRVQAKTVGALLLSVDPADAKITVDGEAVRPGADGMLRLGVGSRTLQVEQDGFEPHRGTLTIAGGQTVPLEVHLVPNARTVVVQSWDEEVTVRLDDAVVGTTRRDPGASPGEPARLILEHIALGERVFELDRECFRTARIEEFLTVGLDDRAPRLLEPVALERSWSRISLGSVPPGASLWVDGRRTHDLPADMIDVCPGRRVVALKLDGRTLWQEAIDLPADERMALDVAVRPNAVLIGAASWPANLAPLEAEVSTIEFRPEAPRGRLEGPDDWRRIGFPEGTDLVVFVDRTAYVIYSPWTGQAHAIDRGLRDPLGRGAHDPRRPRWLSSSIGGGWVDAPGRGVLLARNREGGPLDRAGLAPGDRLVSLAGETALGAIVAEGPALGSDSGGNIKAVVEPVGGERIELELEPEIGPDLRIPPPGVSQSFQAAWGAAVGAWGEELERATALSHLALVLESAGRDREAVRIWKQVRWGDRSGVGEGTTAYYLGRVLAKLGREREAAEAFRRAEASEATAFHDDGVPVAPAARDHLTDLGVATPR